ncbi:hypothetical protein AAF712_009972 [Marasmius tenuissimus]|uniref:Uncharacterized protein n=1 Tax=Marasmius tenuissimus TaxID=585030 RepID=A0ABR2ZPB0_9AGAR
MVPHLYDSTTRQTDRRKCFLYTRSPLARQLTHNTWGVEEFSFTVVGVVGELTEFSVQGRVIPYEKLLVFVKTCPDIVPYLAEGRSIILLDITRFTKSQVRKTADGFGAYLLIAKKDLVVTISADVHVPPDIAEFLRYIVIYLKDRFSFPFDTEYEVAC